MSKRSKKPPSGKEQRKMEELRKEMRKRVAGYMVAGFALVGGLAWNDAIRTLIETLFPSEDTSTVLAKFIYAIIITVVIVVVSVYITKILVRDEDENKK